MSNTSNYNVNCIIHKINKTDKDWFRDYDKYAYFSNSILFGQTSQLANKHVVLPQIGLGVLEEFAFSEWNNGSSNGTIFIEFSLLYLIKKENINIGMIIDYKNGIYKLDEYIVSDKFLSLNLFISI